MSTAKWMSELQAQAEYSKSVTSGALALTFVEWLKFNNVVIREIPFEKRPDWMKAASGR